MSCSNNILVTDPELTDTINSNEINNINNTGVKKVSVLRKKHAVFLLGPLLFLFAYIVVNPNSSANATPTPTDDAKVNNLSLNAISADLTSGPPDLLGKKERESENIIDRNLLKQSSSLIEKSLDYYQSSWRVDLEYVSFIDHIYVFPDNENWEDCTKLAGANIVVSDATNEVVHVEELAVNGCNRIKVEVGKAGSSVQIQSYEGLTFSLDKVEVYGAKRFTALKEITGDVGTALSIEPSVDDGGWKFRQYWHHNLDDKNQRVGKVSVLKDNTIFQTLHGMSSEDHFGYDVAMSEDFLTIAVGAYAATTANGVMSGYIAIYSRSDVDDVFAKHQTINGKEANDSLGAVAMTSDGKLLAVGSHSGDYQYSGHVIVLKRGDNEEQFTEFARVSGKCATEFLAQVALFFVETDDSLVLTAGGQGDCISGEFRHYLVI